MDQDGFLETLKRAISRCQLERYITAACGDYRQAEDHWQIAVNIEEIRRDQASPGGIKGSHGQRRMLQVLTTLWNPRAADELFDQPFSALVPVVMSMDRENREILAELLYCYPGWGD